MVHRFVPKEVEAKQPKIEYTEQYSHRRTVIKYPDPDPRDRVDDEYNYDEDRDQSE
jgi:hypothetical protein